MSISSRISSMEEHVTNAYNGLQGLGADLTGIDKNIDNIAQVLDNIYDDLPKVTGSGTSITLDDTRVGKIKSTLKGNTSQDGTPTPTNPIPVNVVSGDNEIIIANEDNTDSNTYNIDLPVENLLPNLATSFDTTNNGVTKKGENGTYRVYGTATGAFYGVNNALVNNYTIKSGDYLHLCNNSVVSNISIVFYTTNSNFSYEPNAINRIVDLRSYIGETITGIGFYTSASFNGDVTFTPMILQTNKQNSYTPYGTTPIELCKIGTPQDYFYKQNGNWYLYKIIYKKIFNDTDTIEITGTSTTRTLIAYNTGITLESYAGGSVVPNILCTHLISASQGATWVPGDISRRNQNPMSLFYILEAGLTTTTALQWLVNNNVVTYTPMAEPIVTEITYQPLIDQLNELEKAISYEEQTNISQVNNDLPFIISASALKEWQENTSLNSTLSMVNPLSLGNTLNTQENDIQPIEVDNIKPLEEEENEES